MKKAGSGHRVQEGGASSNLNSEREFFDIREVRMMPQESSDYLL
jgi:hypothetical protein